MKKQTSTLLSCNFCILFILLFTNAILAQSNYDIYVLEVKTGEIRQASRIPNASVFNSNWSPDSKKIAHDVVGTIAAPYDQSIFVTDVRTRKSIPLKGAEGGNDAAWSPDGKTIAFDYWDNSVQSIFTVPDDGGIKTLLRYYSHHASWNPKGNKIAFDDNNGYIGTKDIKTGNETFVTNYGDRPAWSPNGQYIAFDNWSGGVAVIKIDPLGNPISAPVQLTTSGYGPTWKNNSKEIVFVDWPNGDPDLYSIPVTGGTPKRIAGRVGGFDKGDYDPAYSNNGNYIAWSSYTDSSCVNRNVEQSDESDKFSNSVATESSNTNNLKIDQNYPNPFFAETSIGIHIPEAAHVVLTIYTMSGQKIKTLTNADYKPGYYTILWNGKDQKDQSLPTGTYIGQLQAGTSNQVIKISLAR